MTEEDKNRLITKCTYAYNKTGGFNNALLAVAKTAQEFRKTGELRSGDEVQVRITGQVGWSDGWIYVGFYNSKKLVIVEDTNSGELRWFSVDNVRLKPKTERRMKEPLNLMKTLVYGGYKVNEDALFVNKETGLSWHPSWFAFCGKVFTPEMGAALVLIDDDWFEEVEVGGDE